MTTVRDCFWLWGHEAGSHNSSWGLPAASRITPAEAAWYMGIPNLIMVRYEGRPSPPYWQYALALQPLQQVVWSVVGAGGQTAREERDHVLDLARRRANITGVMMDDFFRRPEAGQDAGVLNPAELRALREQLQGLSLWVVLYDHQLGLPVERHLALCDRVSLWTWEARNLEHLEASLESLEELAPGCRKVLGCYMWDYGTGRPMPLELMRRQCDLGLGWLRQGRIEGMIFLASCICDLELEAVEWTRQWVAAVGGQRL
ncbi:MAG: hypothetical protein AB1505_18755 [Candidatus Latescibacterota bacterium]